LAVRFYVDADILGLAHILATTRWDVTYPGDPGGKVHRHRRPRCPITEPKTPDLEWMPVVGRAGWLVITRDQHIRQRTKEVEAYYEHNIKCVAIVTQHPKTEKLDTFRQLEIVMSNWRRLDQLADEQGPFVFTLARGGLSKIEPTAPERPRARAAHRTPRPSSTPQLPFE
jgi:hypothetical protein